ncbi:MAG: hypothetical protein ABI480_02530 [Chitinophagaceae bacterium]
MTTERKNEIERRILRAVSRFGLDKSLPEQSISFTELGATCRDISIEDLVMVLKSMDGVRLDLDKHVVVIPMSYFV